MKYLKILGLVSLLLSMQCGRLISNLCNFRSDNYREASPRERVSIVLNRKATTEGYVFKPFLTAKRYPAVVIAHTLGGSKDDQTNLLARRVAKRGFLTLIFDLDGHGSNSVPFDEATAIYNISRAVDYLFTRQDVDRENIFVVGADLGAVLAIKAGEIDWRIKGIAAIEALYRLDINIFRFVTEANILHLLHPAEVRFYNDKGSLVSLINKKLETLDIKNVITKIAPDPLLLIHAEKDGLIGLDQARELYELAGNPKELKVIPGTRYHSLLSNRDMTDHLVAWLKINSS